MDTADAWPCPQCGAEMPTRPFGPGQVRVCPEGHGVFLPRADLGELIEAESDWHNLASQGTMPIPRITAEMEAPPAFKAHARAWVETLFT